MNKVKQKKGFFPAVTGAARRGRTDYYDFNLLAVIVLLTCCRSDHVCYSTSAYMAQVKYGDDMTFFKKQALISVVCISVAIVISMIDYHILTYFTTLLYAAAMILMALVQTPWESR